MADETATLFSVKLNYGALNYELGAEFLLALILSLSIVFLFSLNKFQEPTFLRDENDPTTQLLPKYLASPKQYSMAHMMYVAGMLLLLVLLSLLGPRALPIDSASRAPASVPLAAALVLVGALPNVPWLQEVEKLLRKFAHARAFIPSWVRTESARLAAAEFDFSQYRDPEILSSPALRGVDPRDFERRRHSLEYQWARLSCLVYQIDHNRDVGPARNLDPELMRSYGADVEQIVISRKAMEDDVADYRRRRSRNPGHTNDDLRRKIGKTLDQLYVLLVCGVRLRKDSADLSSVLQSFGFKLSIDRTPANDNLLITSAAVMACSTFAVVQAALWLAPAGRVSGLWTPSPDFPCSPFDPIAWPLSALILHASALMTAERIRARRLENGLWFADMAGGRQRVAANYVRVGLASAAVGFVALYLWQLVYEPPSLYVAQKQVGYALLAAATGAFLAFHLDNAELRQRPRRAIEIAAQAVATGFLGYLGAKVWLDVARPGAAVHDLPILVAALNAALGAGLGWFVPKAATRRCAQCEQAWRTRLDVLQAEAQQSLGAEASAASWLDAPHAELANRSPAVAAKDIHGFQRARALLKTALPEPVG